MNDSISKGLAIVVVGALALFSQTVFVVEQVEQGLVVQLGQPQRVIAEPGLNYKIPFLETVYLFDKRLLELNQDPQDVLSSDKKNLRVGNYARWRIVDPLKFYQTFQDERGAVLRLTDIIHSNLREVLGQFSMMEIVSGARTDLMHAIRDGVNKQTSDYGIRVEDVRIRATDLPPENSKAVFRRMQTERERQAKQYRAEGEEEAVKIRAKADREREVILAQAYEKAQKIRGEGDAEAMRIYADGFQKDPKFYSFIRSLEAYRRSFKNNTTVILETKSPFFQHFSSP